MQYGSITTVLLIIVNKTGRQANSRKEGGMKIAIWVVLMVVNAAAAGIFIWNIRKECHGYDRGEWSLIGGTAALFAASAVGFGLALAA